MRREWRRCLTTSELIKKYKIGSNTFFLEVTERDKITNCIFARVICVRSLIKKKKGKKRRYSNCRYVLKSLICRTNIQTREKYCVEAPREWKKRKEENQVRSSIIRWRHENRVKCDLRIIIRKGDENISLHLFFIIRL